MIPKSPSEMTNLIVQILMLRIYGDITAAARRGRISEHDIALIERSAIRAIKEGPDFSHEFETFEAEPAVAAGIKLVEDFLATTRSARINQIQNK
mgnify:CR=1 FL=1